MAPIEIQTSKPINTSAAEDAPRTSATQATGTISAQQHSTQAPLPSAASYPPPTTTSGSLPSPSDTTSTSTSAAPGARPPGPTAAPFATAAQSSFPPPTRTTAPDVANTFGDPPAPQPGQTPVPPPPPPPPVSADSKLPPPPRPGQAPYQPPYMPDTHASAGLHGAQRSAEANLSHPPGYQQNASVMAERDPKSSPETSTRLGSIGVASGERQDGLPLGGNATEGGSILGDSAKMQEQAGEAWTAVKGWAGAAGSKLAAVEKDVWNWVDKKT